MAATGGATCSRCKMSYHKQCVALGAASPKHWICPCCTVDMPRQDNTDTPVKGICEESPVERRPRGEDTIVKEPSTKCEIDVDWGKQLVSAITALRLETENLRKEISNLRSELGAVKNDLSTCKSDLSAVSETVKTLEKRICSLENRQEPDKSTTGLEQTVAELKNELNNRDQCLLSNDLEISGIPENEHENPQHIVKTLALKMGIDLQDQDVADVFRSGPRHLVADHTENAQRRPRTIVVRLVRRSTRDCLLQAARVRRSLSTSDMGLSGPRCNIYMNERLTKFNRNLLRQAKEEARRLQWKFIWTKNGQILIRRREGETVYRIVSQQDLDHVFNETKS